MEYENDSFKYKDIFYAKLRYILSNTKCNLFKIFRIFPLKKNEILFMSFDGKQFSDSPKYLYEELRKDKTKKMIWAFYEPLKFNYLVDKDVSIINRNSIQFTYKMFTAGTIITNNHISNTFSVRKNQIILNTWHGGSPLKTIGFAESKQVPYNYYYYKMQNKKYSAYISSSDFMTNEVFIKSFGYTGEILEFGMPRNDILLSNYDQVKKKVYSYFNLTNDSSIVLYAPTFRGNFSDSFFIPSEEQFNINECLNVLEQKFKKNFIFLFRAHHAMVNNLQGSNYVNASDYPDMQELLCASDILITDYSSCMGDMALMKKPVFLYTPDLDDYIKDRGFYWNIYSLPFPVCKTEKDFYHSIKDFNNDSYRVNIDEYLNKLGSYESNNSIKLTIEWLKRQWKGRK